MACIITAYTYYAYLHINFDLRYKAIYDIVLIKQYLQNSLYKFTFIVDKSRRTEKITSKTLFIFSKINNLN